MVSVAFVGVMGVLQTFSVLAGYAVCLVEHPTLFWMFVWTSFTFPLIEAFTNKESLADFLGFFGFVFLI